MKTGFVEVYCQQLGSRVTIPLFTIHVVAKMYIIVEVGSGDKRVGDPVLLCDQNSDQEVSFSYQPSLIIFPR